MVESLGEPPSYPRYVELPRYEPKGMIIVGAVGAVLTLAAFVVSASGLTPVAWWVAVAISVGITAGAVLVIHCPFAFGWMRAHWRRARSYEALSDYAKEITAEHALYGGVRLLPVIGLQKSRGRPQIILRLRPSNGVARGDYLLILDTVSVGVVGRAQVSAFRAGRCFADILETDAMLGGYVRQPTSVSLPDTIVLVREVDVRAVDERMQRLAGEGAP